MARAKADRRLHEGGPMQERRGDRGFSLVELMIAMTVTLIVSGAIYGLLTSGSNAFRREPELADRQQNIRVAMDLISRDVYNAGAALPTFSQVFSRSDPAGGGCTGSEGVNGCGVSGTLGADAAADRAPGDSGDPSENTDVLEIVTVDEQCGVQSVCSKDPKAGEAGLFVIREGVPGCFSLPSLLLLTDNSAFTVQPAVAATSAAAPCPGTGGTAARNGNLQLGARLDPWDDSPAIDSPADSPPPAMPSVFAYRARVVRYRIAASTDPADPTPALWRSESGRYAVDGSLVDEPGGVGFPAAGSPWELVARGIEDLQIEYFAGDNVWRNRAPVSVPADWTTLVRQVRITLSARAAGANLQGQTTAGGGAPNAVRGQLASVVAPRAALTELQMGKQIQ
jgi:prepilin-type N-terminal cleavage/methylation domain-containing protein